MIPTKPCEFCAFTNLNHHQPWQEEDFKENLIKDHHWQNQFVPGEETFLKWEMALGGGGRERLTRKYPAAKEAAIKVWVLFMLSYRQTARVILLTAIKL